MCFFLTPHPPSDNPPTPSPRCLMTSLAARILQRTEPTGLWVVPGSLEWEDWEVLLGGGVNPAEVTTRPSVLRVGCVSVLTLLRLLRWRR